MAEQGYWVVCEDIHIGNKKTGEPALCIAHVDGFHYVDVMGETRMEVMALVRKKIKENIGFLMSCYNEVPPLSTSDKPPQGQLVHGAAYIFVGLSELGLMAEMLNVA